MRARLFEKEITLDGSQAADTMLFDRPFTGEILSIEAVPDGTNPYNTGGVAATITRTSTGATVMTFATLATNAGVVPKCPLQNAHDPATGNAIGTTVKRPIILVNENLRIVLSGTGGAGKKGKWVVIGVQYSQR